MTATSPALAQSGTDPYSVEFAPSASRALANAPLPVSVQIRRHLGQIADVAGTLASVVADGVGSTLRLEIAGHVVSYAVCDARQVLTVLEVALPGAK